LSPETSLPETAIEVVHQTFSSIDQLREETAGWDLDWRQLDRGPLDAPHVLIASPNAFFTRFSFNRRFLQRGHSPAGRLTFGLLGESVGEIDWCRAAADNRHLLIFNSGSDYESVSQPGFNGNTMSYSEDHLESIVRNLELDVTFDRYRNVETALQIDPAGASDLRQHLQQLNRATSAEPGEIGSEWIRNELEYEIPAKLLRLLATNPQRESSLVDGFKARAARRARDYIDAHASESPTIQEVSRTAGVSWRSLDYAFRELFGVTPKQYLQATRLDGVHKDLRRRGPDVKIADIANAWGFWHMGQFAKDFKRQFGELPSATIRRSGTA